MQASATIRLFRQLHGHSVQQLAMHTGANRFKIRRLEKGEQNPDEEFVRKFCKFYRCTLQAFYRPSAELAQILDCALDPAE